MHSFLPISRLSGTKGHMDRARCSEIATIKARLDFTFTDEAEKVRLIVNVLLIY
jgi:hypothetical protein